MFLSLSQARDCCFSFLSPPLKSIVVFVVVSVRPIISSWLVVSQWSLTWSRRIDGRTALIDSLTRLCAYRIQDISDFLSYETLASDRNQWNGGGGSSNNNDDDFRYDRFTEKGRKNENKRKREDEGERGSSICTGSFAAKHFSPIIIIYLFVCSAWSTRSRLLASCILQGFFFFFFFSFEPRSTCLLCRNAANKKAEWPATTLFTWTGNEQAGLSCQ